MNLKSKIAAGLAVVALAASLTVPTSAANAGGHHGWGIAGAVIGGAIVAGAVANAYAEPVYVDGYRRCRFERQYNSYGDYVGTAKVCRYY
ncbi:hypothetical protein [Rhodoplanes sp. Z2-YC6860]|uniref:hypothetical protein n=1 Tax=Rhodoplanes sp. Z2-YC6860 TaxID=674703 RepID=UPI00078E435A|nr:hypothetical protein [Rhodoplanes sp. Z2-YC6860]AMN41301.1 hypothetical protein RHPLAN_28640 [Rhodoplanes sp. Z2-YC6860]